ncbi:hypothetical protein ACFLVL_02605 [Chloroflexota bacterium]
MMWFRRLLTVPLIIIFVALLIATLVLTQVNGTVGNADFYNDQLQRADMYNFIYDEVIPVALDELEIDDSSDLPIDISAIKDDIASAARKILPPEWIQEQVELTTTTFIPYILGDTDEFTYTATLKDRIEKAAEIIKSDILDGDTAATLYSDGISYIADKVIDNLDEVPYPLLLSKEQIENSLKEIIALDWITSQAKAAIDSIEPYLIGDSDDFTITIQLYDRIDSAALALVDLVGGQETYDFLLDEFIPLMVKLYFESIIQLPFDISVTQDEISSTIKQVLPQSWVQDRLDDLVNSVVSYVKGDATNINVTISLVDRKATALTALTDLAEQKLKDMFDSLRVCDLTEFLQVMQNLEEGELPDCRPTGVTYQDFKATLNIDVSSFIDQIIGDQMPNQWIYTDVELRWAFGENNEHLLDDIREWVTNGWTFTYADLLGHLDIDDVQTIDDVRDWIKDGYTLDETELRDLITDNTNETLDTVDDVRHWTGTGRTWLWALWLVPLLLLLSIGFLGGRKWRHKLYWALILLFLVSLIIYIAAGPVYSNVGKPQIDDVISDVIDDASSEFEDNGELVTLINAKGKEVLVNVSDALIPGMKNKALYTMIVSGALLAGVIALGILNRGKRSTPSDG